MSWDIFFWFLKWSERPLTSQNAVLSCDKTQTKKNLAETKKKKRSDNLRSLCQKYFVRCKSILNQNLYKCCILNCNYSIFI